MRNLSRLLAISAAALTAFSLTACSQGGSSGAEKTSSSSKTLNVWFMQAGPFLDTSLPAINKQFESKTGAKVNVQVQQWPDINTKITTALASDSPPDVLEMGNTNIPLFATSGGLLDITSDKSTLQQGQTWLPGLETPATVDGKLYAAPLHAGTRAVIYNKKVWAAAGIRDAPKTFEELTTDLDKIKAKNTASDYSALYLSGGNWYGALSFVFDAGGALAKQVGGEWQGQMSTPQSQQGLREFKQFQNAYSSKASQSANASTPDPNELFANGKASAILAANPGAVSAIEAAAPAMKGNIGSFAMPSKSKPGSNMPAWVGGTEVAISAKSRSADLATQYLELLASPSTQTKYISGIDGDIPISEALINTVLPSVSAPQKAFYTAAKISVGVPATPGWATLETDNSIADLFIEVATGVKSSDATAAAFDSHLATALAAGK